MTALVPADVVVTTAVCPEGATGAGRGTTGRVTGRVTGIVRSWL
jgi:hypothetical protein